MGKIIRRILTIIPAVALQSLWLLLLMKWLTPYAPIIVSLLSVAAFFLVVFIIIKRDETAYKLLWLLVILSLPLVGALLYLLFGNKRTARPLKRRLQQVQKSCNPQPLPIKEAPFDGEKRMGQTVRWLEEKTQYPMCAVEQVRYYPLGDNMFPDMLADLKNARNSIYVEYFIIESGHMWDAIVNELEVKMEQGVDVRVIYYDSPLNHEATSNQLFIDLLSQSTDYAWFFTPYLMLGDDLMDAMISAAQRGVDVRIIMPGIPDKKLIFRMSRSFYQVLLTGGIKIYEYTPGFVHAKSFVSDDKVATIGTVNLDYRSLFLHFENNSFFYRSSIIAAIKDDFIATQAKCKEVKPYDMKHYSRRWVVDGVLRIFAPLC